MQKSNFELMKELQFILSDMSQDMEKLDLRLRKEWRKNEKIKETKKTEERNQERRKANGRYRKGNVQFVRRARRKY